MKAEILQEFKGEINGVFFNDSSIYYSTKFILEKVNEKFGEIYTEDFIKDLRNTIEELYRKYDEFSFEILENDFVVSIREAEIFEEIEFSYYGNTWKIDDLNDDIKSYRYTKEHLKNSITKDISLEELIRKLEDMDFYELEYENNEIIHDRDIALSVIGENGYFLKYFSKELQRDKEIVQKALKNEKEAIIYADDKIRKELEKSKKNKKEKEIER